MEKRYIEPSHPVFVIKGLSGKKYFFDFINLNQVRSMKKLKTVKGDTFFLCISNIDNKAPSLINIGYKRFNSIDIHTPNLFFGCDFFLCLIDFDRDDTHLIHDDIVNGNSFNYSYFKGV